MICDELVYIHRIVRLNRLPVMYTTTNNLASQLMFSLKVISKYLYMYLSLFLKKVVTYWFVNNTLPMLLHKDISKKEKMKSMNSREGEILLLLISRDHWCLFQQDRSNIAVHLYICIILSTDIDTSETIIHGKV